MKQIPLKEVTTLIEYKGEFYTPEEIAKLWNVDYDTFMVTVQE